jgi:hypothetical protein
LGEVPGCARARAAAAETNRRLSRTLGVEKADWLLFNVTMVLDFEPQTPGEVQFREEIFCRLLIIIN